MKTVFLDCGAFDGCSIKKARELWKDCEIHSFEPNPVNLEKLQKIEGINIIPYAVWTFDGYIKFYRGLPESGTVLYGKKTGKIDYTKNISVKCLNFSRWVRENLSQTDYNILKLNIEGAEYDILEALNRNKLLGYFKEFYIQWHSEKIIGFDKSRHDKISKLIRWNKWEVM